MTAATRAMLDRHPLRQTGTPSATGRQVPARGKLMMRKKNAFAALEDRLALRKLTVSGR